MVLDLQEKNKKSKKNKNDFFLQVQQKEEKYT